MAKSDSYYRDQFVQAARDKKAKSKASPSPTAPASSGSGSKSGSSGTKKPSSPKAGTKPMEETKFKGATKDAPGVMKDSRNKSVKKRPGGGKVVTKTTPSGKTKKIVKDRDGNVKKTTIINTNAKGKKVVKTKKADGSTSRTVKSGGKKRTVSKGKGGQIRTITKTKDGKTTTKGRNSAEVKARRGTARAMESGKGKLAQKGQKLTSRIAKAKASGNTEKVAQLKKRKYGVKRKMIQNRSKKLKGRKTPK